MPFSNAMCPVAHSFQSYAAPSIFAVCCAQNGIHSEEPCDYRGPNSDDIGYQAGVVLRKLVIDPASHVLDTLSGIAGKVSNAVGSFFSNAAAVLPSLPLSSFFADAHEIRNRVGVSREKDPATGKWVPVTRDAKITEDQYEHRTIETVLVEAGEELDSVSGSVTPVDLSVGRKPEKSTPVLESKTSIGRKSKESGTSTEGAKERSSYGVETVDKVRVKITPNKTTAKNEKEGVIKLAGIAPKDQRSGSSTSGSNRYYYGVDELVIDKQQLGPEISMRPTGAGDFIITLTVGEDPACESSEMSDDPTCKLSKMLNDLDALFINDVSFREIIEKSQSQPAGPKVEQHPIIAIRGGSKTNQVICEGSDCTVVLSDKKSTVGEVTGGTVKAKAEKEL